MIKKKTIKSFARNFTGIVDPISGAALKTLQDMYQSIQKDRANRFFRDLQKAIIKSETEKRGEELINNLKESKNLQESLFDFVQSAVRTRSDLGVAMLAIAYSNILNAEKNSFFIEACVSLREISEDSLKFFQEITNQQKLDSFLKPNRYFQEYHNKNGFYLITLSDANVTNNLLTTYLKKGNKTEDTLNFISDLKSRKMIIQCESPSIDDQGYECFGIGEKSLKYRKLLIDAENLVSKDSSSTFQ